MTVRLTLALALLIVCSSSAWSADFGSLGRGKVLTKVPGVETASVPKVVPVSGEPTEARPRKPKKPVITQNEILRGPIHGQVLDSKIPAQTKLQLPADLSVTIEAERDTYARDMFGYTGGVVTNHGPSHYRGGDTIQVFAVQKNGQRTLIHYSKINALRAGQSQRYYQKWPNVDAYKDCTFYVMIVVNDGNDRNNSASCGWKFGGATP